MYLSISIKWYALYKKHKNFSPGHRGQHSPGSAGSGFEQGV